LNRKKRPATDDNLSLFAAPAFDADELARERAIAVGESFIVQAPAGSGKTELLVQRFLALLATVDEPETIVAITFTRKAAGEMRARIAEALRDAATSKLPPEEGHKHKRWELARAVLAQDARQGWNLLQTPSRMRIVTIDSLCYSIVRQTPWTSEVGSVRGVVDNAEDLYAAAAHRTVQLLGDGGQIADDLRRALIHLDNGVPELEGELVKMFQRRDQWLRHLENHDLDSARQQMESVLHRLVSERLEEINNLIPATLRSELARLGRVAAENLRIKDPDHHVVGCLGISSFPQCSPGALPAWRGIVSLLVTSGKDWRAEGGINARLGFPKQNFKDKASLCDIIAQLRGVPGALDALVSVRKLPPDQFSDSQWEMLATFVRILPRAVEQLKAVFAEQQACDYIEITQAALKAMGTDVTPSSLALALGHSVEHLLVDEFQDTSLTQVRLLETLTASWKAGDGRSLFLVGDPMQSIYRFRQAEVGSFIRTAGEERFGKLRVEQLRLEKNFRSRQTIVDWINRVFPGVFPVSEDVTSSAVPFVACRSAARDRELESVVAVHAMFGSRDEVRRQEAQKVLTLVQDLIGRGEKVAILVRSRNHLFNILACLREASSADSRLRFQAVEIEQLGEQAIIGDLRALTHALLHLGNRVAWLAILRAPWCGLSLADLHRLVDDGKLATVWQLLKQRTSALSEDGQSRLARVLPVLEAALASRGRLPLRQWVESTWVSLHGPACLKDNRELEDAESYFELLDALDAGADLESLARLEKSVAKLFSKPDPDATDHIQIMTIHKAKGLEFDAVILPSLGRTSGSDDESLLLWDERTTDTGPELLMAPMKARGDDDDPIYKFLQSIENERTDNESRRLLYVAVTRARHELHPFGDVGRTAQDFLEDGKGPEKKSLLWLLWPAVRGEFEAQARDVLDTSIRIDASSEAIPQRTLSRLPLTWTAPSIPADVPAQLGREPETIDFDEEVTYDWAGERARRVGIVVHTVLQRIANEGLENWSAGRIHTMQPALRAALTNQGAAPGDIPDLLTRTERALITAITDSKGRWILQEHPEAQNEFTLTGSAGGQLNNFVIDRTFVVDGTRWIIDYKTGSREGGDANAFLDNEKTRYKEKMDRYAEIFRAFDPTLPVKLGLYFPLMNGWREWEA
jgi:ATP-dependent exoDNAse (exonuclease V) beta subunit